MRKRTSRQHKRVVSAQDDRAAKEEVLAVLVDIDNRHEYYMSFIDAFQIKGREYVVMYPYEPEDGRYRNPELTILRSLRHENGEQYYLSIKDRRELQNAFNHFFKRFEQSANAT